MFHLSLHDQIAIVVNDVDGPSEPFDIAVDPYGRTIFWTCAMSDDIKMTSIDTPRSRSSINVILSSDDDLRPRSIVILPEKG